MERSYGFLSNFFQNKQTLYYVNLYDALSRFLIDPIAITCWINLGARFVTKFIANYEPVSTFLIDPIAITCWINLGARFVTKFIAKVRFFLMAVYMIFKYSKRFRFAPSFNKLCQSCDLVIKKKDKEYMLTWVMNAMKSRSCDFYTSESLTIWVFEVKEIDSEVQISAREFLHGLNFRL